MRSAGLLACIISVASLASGCAAEGGDAHGWPDRGQSVHEIDCDPYARPTIGAGAGQSWRWGGGKGYPDIVPTTDCNVTLVDTKTELENALAVAVAGNIIYVDDDADIDLGDSEICIPAGVTLASGRGRVTNGVTAPGAILRVTRGNGAAANGGPVIQACGDNVRVTGLRIRGEETTIARPARFIMTSTRAAPMPPTATMQTRHRAGPGPEAASGSATRRMAVHGTT